MKQLNTLPEEEFKVMVIKIFINLRRRMDKHRKNFNREIGNISKYQTEVTELKNTITEKYTGGVQQ